MGVDRRYDLVQRELGALPCRESSAKARDTERIMGLVRDSPAHEFIQYVAESQKVSGGREMYASLESGWGVVALETILGVHANALRRTADVRAFAALAADESVAVMGIVGYCLLRLPKPSERWSHPSIHAYFARREPLSYLARIEYDEVFMRAARRVVDECVQPQRVAHVASVAAGFVREDPVVRAAVNRLERERQQEQDQVLAQYVRADEVASFIDARVKPQLSSIVSAVRNTNDAARIIVDVVKAMRERAEEDWVILDQHVAAAEYRGSERVDAVQQHLNQRIDGVHAEVAETSRQLSKIVGMVDRSLAVADERTKAVLGRADSMAERIASKYAAQADARVGEVARTVGQQVELLRREMYAHVESMAREMHEAVRREMHHGAREGREQQIESQVRGVHAALGDYTAAQRRALDAARIAEYVNARVDQLSERLDAMREPKGLETVLSRLDEVARDVSDMRSAFEMLGTGPEVPLENMLKVHIGRGRKLDGK